MVEVAPIRPEREQVVEGPMTVSGTPAAAAHQQQQPKQPQAASTSDFLALRLFQRFTVRSFAKAVPVLYRSLRQHHPGVIEPCPPEVREFPRSVAVVCNRPPNPRLGQVGPHRFRSGISGGKCGGKPIMPSLQAGSQIRSSNASCVIRWMVDGNGVGELKASITFTLYFSSFRTDPVLSHLRSRLGGPSC